MRRPLAATAAVLAALLTAPASAPAKEVTKVAVCGADHHCVTYDKSDFKDLMFLVSDGGPTDPPRAPAPYVRVRFTVAEGPDVSDHWSVVYVPSAHLVRARGEGSRWAWLSARPRTARMFDAAAAKVKPFPASALRGLHPEPIEAKVAEVYEPAAGHDASSSGSSGALWAIPAVVAAAAALVGAAALRRAGGVTRA